MRGIVCEKPDQLAYFEAEEPRLEAGEAIVRVRRIGVCGTDLHAYKGNQPFFAYPRILGHELSGIVEMVAEEAGGPEGSTSSTNGSTSSVGSNASTDSTSPTSSTSLRPGDQVSVIPYMHCGTCVACRGGKTNCCVNMQVLGVHRDGGMRERIAVPVTHLLRTEGLSLDEAAILEPMSIGAHAVRRSELHAGETVLVIGAGPIGLGVMALAKRRGATVIAMDINDERLAFCRNWARVDHAVNAMGEPLAEIAALTDGDLPTIVYDATGNARSMTEAFRYTAHGGKLVYVGLVKADITFHDPEFHKRELTLLASRNATREDFETVISAVREGVIDAGRFITHRVPFGQTIEQFESWMKPENKVIKAIIELE